MVPVSILCLKCIIHSGTVPCAILVYFKKIFLLISFPTTLKFSRLRDIMTIIITKARRIIWL